MAGRWSSVSLVCVGLIAIFASATPTMAECTITITYDAPPTAENMIANPGFEDGKSPWILFNTGEEDGVTDAESHSGNYSLKFVGEKITKDEKEVAKHKGARQHPAGYKEFDPPIPANTPYVISGWLKLENPYYEGRKGIPGLSAVVTYAVKDENGKDKWSYIPSPTWTRTTRGWTKGVMRAKRDMPIKRLTWLYVCYYNQEGTAYFDDIYFGFGTAKLSLKVDCPDIKQVKLYGEEMGLVKAGKELPKGTNTHSDTVEVQIRERYVVEVTDHAGKKYAERYPKEEGEIIVPKP